MKKYRKIEKKIYELLGVNLFRKYILFGYEKILKKFFHFDVGYRLNSLNIEGLKEYQKQAVVFGIAHVITFFFIFIITKDLFYWFNWVFNIYCIMVQRYNYIRIESVLEKKEKLKYKKILSQTNYEIINKKQLSQNKELEIPSYLYNYFDFNKMSAIKYLSFFEILLCIEKLNQLGIQEEEIIFFVEVQMKFNLSFGIDLQVFYPINNINNPSFYLFNEGLKRLMNPLLDHNIQKLERSLTDQA